MGKAIDTLSLRGFKSIKAIENLELGNLNVLIGANGAGKSNFVEFFRMLRAMADEGLQNYVLESGGSDGFLFLGPKVTKEISCRVDFGKNWYGYTLQPTASGSLLISSEITGYLDYSSTASGLTESTIKSNKDGKSRQYANQWGVGHYIYESISSWTVYHFHDTSALAPMRRDQPLRDIERFRHDASNLAAFLLSLREEKNGSYELIRDTVKLMCPSRQPHLLAEPLSGQAAGFPPRRPAMARQQRDPMKEAYWREVLGRQGSSGLSVREFCQRDGLTESQFYAWRRTIGQRDRDSTPSFVPVVVNDPPQSDASIAIELVGGQVLKLPASTPAAWLADLVLTLESRGARNDCR